MNGLAPQMRKPGMPHHAGQTCPSWPQGLGGDRSEKICWCTLSGGPPVMERDHLLESGPTSPLPSRVWRWFPTSHEFRGNRDRGCPRPLTAPTTLANHTISRQRRPTQSHGALTGPPQTRRPFQAQGMKRALREPCRRRRRGISVPESPHCRTEWHPRSFATISPQIAQRMSLTRCWQRLPLPRPRKKEMTVCPAGNELATTRKYGEG